MSELVSIYKGLTRAEREVANFLKKKLGIYCTFEQPVFVIDDAERPRIYSPDFYLPELGLYIEVCGHPDIDYSYREKIYKDNRIPVIFVEEYKEGKKWKKFLTMRIKEIHDKRSEIMIRNLKR